MGLSKRKKIKVISRLLSYPQVTGNIPQCIRFKHRHFPLSELPGNKKKYTNPVVMPVMVFIEDREGIFDAPIDKVWKLAKAHSAEGSKFIQVPKILR
jgi:hypothetical protein